MATVPIRQPTAQQVSHAIITGAMRVHTELGPGLLESVYHVILVYELQKHGLRVKSRDPVPVVLDDVKLDVGFEADVIVEDTLVLELKAIETVARVHKRQLLTYLKLTDCRLGLLINFGADLIKDGISRVVNGLKN